MPIAPREHTTAFGEEQRVAPCRGHGDTLRCRRVAACRSETNGRGERGIGGNATAHKRYPTNFSGISCCACNEVAGSMTNENDCAFRTARNGKRNVGRGYLARRWAPQLRPAPEAPRPATTPSVNVAACGDNYSVRSAARDARHGGITLDARRISNATACAEIT